MKHKRVIITSDISGFQLSKLVAGLETLDSTTEVDKRDKAAICVLRAMADRHPKIWPSVKTISKDAGLTEAYTRRQIRKLEDLWLIAEVIPEGGKSVKKGGRDRTVQYVLNTERITELHELSHPKPDTKPDTEAAKPDTDFFKPDTESAKPDTELGKPDNQYPPNPITSIPEQNIQQNREQDTEQNRDQSSNTSLNADSQNSETVATPETVRDYQTECALRSGNYGVNNTASKHIPNSDPIPAESLPAQEIDAEGGLPGTVITDNFLPLADMRDAVLEESGRKVFFPAEDHDRYRELIKQYGKTALLLALRDVCRHIRPGFIDRRFSGYFLDVGPTILGANSTVSDSEVNALFDLMAERIREEQDGVEIAFPESDHNQYRQLLSEHSPEEITDAASEIAGTIGNDAMLFESFDWLNGFSGYFLKHGPVAVPMMV